MWAMFVESRKRRGPALKDRRTIPQSTPHDCCIGPRDRKDFQTRYDIVHDYFQEPPFSLTVGYDKVNQVLCWLLRQKA
jgi:hypothetical protein